LFNETHISDLVKSIKGGNSFIMNLPASLLEEKGE
jgi:hypothetical protein